jgi:adsorption protein B
MTGGLPFDSESLTEDYELGLTVAAAGGSQTFARILSCGAPIATRGYFPATVATAVAQKARWMTGIALSGWDRLGWCGGLAERWMRLRDRQSILAAVLMAAGYVGFSLCLALEGAQLLSAWKPQPVSGALRLLLVVNLAMLAWRVAMRGAFVTQAYGWRDGLMSVPRMAVGNLIGILAAHRAVLRYWRIKGGGRADWDKTAHSFPSTLARA